VLIPILRLTGWCARGRGGGRGGAGSGAGALGLGKEAASLGAGAPPGAASSGAAGAGAPGVAAASSGRGLRRREEEFGGGRVDQFDRYKGGRRQDLWRRPPGTRHISCHV
jgi:hypothetical protein